MHLLGFWEFLKFFVRDLYANLAIVGFGEFKAFAVSVTCVFQCCWRVRLPPPSKKGKLCKDQRLSFWLAQGANLRGPVTPSVVLVARLFTRGVLLYQ